MIINLIQDSIVTISVVPDTVYIATKNIDKFSTSEITSIAAIIISAFALFAMIYQMILQRKHMKLSVLPNIRFDTKFNVGNFSNICSFL